MRRVGRSGDDDDDEMTGLSNRKKASAESVM